MAVAWCGIGARIVTRARDLARRGDARRARRGAGGGAGSAASRRSPRRSCRRPRWRAAPRSCGCCWSAASGADRPFCLPVGVTGLAFERVIFVTPLCAARMKRRAAVESLLLAAGAREDVFTSAFLGDLASLARMLAADPGLAQAADPAVDVLDITPVDHAVAGGQAAALRLLLDHVAHPLPGACAALRGAAAQGSLAMAELLLARGADATRIGVGRWVLHPELAPLLASRGAAIDSSGSWIGASLHRKPGPQGRPGVRPRPAAPRRPRDRPPERRPERRDRCPGPQRDSAALRRQGRLPADHRGAPRARSRPGRPRQPRPHAARLAGTSGTVGAAGRSPEPAHTRATSMRTG